MKKCGWPGTWQGGLGMRRGGVFSGDKVGVLSRETLGATSQAIRRSLDCVLRILFLFFKFLSLFNYLVSLVISTPDVGLELIT